MFYERMVIVMSTPKYKHFRFEDRYVIQEFLKAGFSFSAIANRLGKDRRAVSKEVLKHRFLKSGSNKHKLDCPLLDKPPYVCNGCADSTKCRMNQYIYEASVADNEYQKTLRQERARLHISKESVAAINDVIAPLMIYKHHSVNHVFAAHPELLPMSKATFYRYVDLGILNVRNIDLQRKVRFRVKKEYDYSRSCSVDKGIRLGRFYRDFQDYMELHPNASVVEMDTVIGTMGGKGGKCFLTLLFRTFNLMLIYVLPYKRSEHVTVVFNQLKALLGEDTFSRLFEVILTDNGTEFSDPESIEISTKTGDRLSRVFFCDPNCSWQKGCIENNHHYIRCVLPKGTSFAGITQADATLLASHINSVPRMILNNQSPYEAALGFIGKDNMDKLGIQKINNDDIDLSIRLLKR